MTICIDDIATFVKKSLTITNDSFWQLSKYKSRDAGIRWTRHKQKVFAATSYRIAGFSHKDFNLAVWSIRNIKIRKKFHHVKIYFASTCMGLLELFTVLMKVLFVFSSLFITQNS